MGVRTVALAALLAAVIAPLPLRAQEHEPLRLLVQGGGGFWDRPWEASAFGSVALARDLPLAHGSRFAAAGEVHPLVVVRQRQRDHVSNETRAASALAALLVYRGGALADGWGFRVEAGTGVLYSWSGAVPADGTRLNFFDQGGASLVWSGTRKWSAGYRFVHASNLGLLGEGRNPGVSFHALVVSVGWR